MSTIMTYQLPLTADEAEALRLAFKGQVALAVDLVDGLTLLRRQAENAEPAKLLKTIDELLEATKHGVEMARVIHELAGRIHYVPPGSKGGTA